MELKTTPLYEKCKQLGGRFVDFHGWYLPLQFDGILVEHQHVRSKVGIFDCSHMTEFLIHGNDKIREFSYRTITDFEKLPVGMCKYTALLSEEGTIIDDCVGVKWDAETLFVVANAGTQHEVANILCGDSIHAQDMSDQTVKIDIQGPWSREILLQNGFDCVAELKYWRGSLGQWKGKDFFITRAGYTGELGYELYLPVEIGAEIWDILVNTPEVKPCGLGARDTLRTEMGYPLSGQDIDPTMTPLEASMDRFIDWQHEFVGKDILRRQQSNGSYRRLVGIRTRTRQSPRHGQVLVANEREVGVVTSGTYGPSVGTGVGLARVDLPYSQVGSVFTIKDKNVAVEVCETPIYKGGTARIQFS